MRGCVQETGELSETCGEWCGGKRALSVGKLRSSSNGDAEWISEYGGRRFVGWTDTPNSQSERASARGRWQSVSGVNRAATMSAEGIRVFTNEAEGVKERRWHRHRAVARHGSKMGDRERRRYITTRSPQANASQAHNRRGEGRRRRKRSRGKGGESREGVVVGDEADAWERT